jgi:hypothetical protein
MHEHPQKITHKLRDGTEIQIGPRVAQILEYVFDHPTAAPKDIAKHFGISAARVYQVVKNKKFIAAMPKVARKRYQALIPKALKAQEELIEQRENLMVSDKASARALESSKVFEIQSQNTQNVFINMRIEDLRNVIDRTPPVQGPIVDAEIDEDPPK